MRFLVGQVAGGSAVFLVSGHNAINLTERDPSIGSDLMGIIMAGMNSTDIESRAAGATAVPLATGQSVHKITARRLVRNTSNTRQYRESGFVLGLTAAIRCALNECPLCAALAYYSNSTA